MKFENKGKWFNESEDTDKDMLNDEQQELAMEDDAADLLAEDELDLVDEDIDDDSEDIFNDEEQVDEACKYRNEVRYIDPANLNKYSKDEIEEVTTASGEKRYKRKGGSPAVQRKEPKQMNSFNRDSAKAYIDDITQDVEDDGVTLKKDYYNRKLDYSGDLRNPKNWPTSVNDIFSHQYKIRHKLYDQFKDYALSDEGRKENEKYLQQYNDVYDDATKALKNVDKKDRFDMIDAYYKNADYANDESGDKTAKIQQILRSFDYDIKNKNDMRKAYKDLKAKM